MNLAIAILTGMLVIVTAYYAWQTRHTVKIMREQQTASLRPLLVFACREGNWHVVNVGSGPAVNGRYETSYQKTATHFAHIGGPGGTRDASPSGPLEPLGAGDIHDHTVYFEPALHALLTYENLAGRRYWSRYCPQKQCWDSGEGNVAQGDFGCDCKLDDKGHIVRQVQE
jgi:hypothetical protein